ncbi:MAG: leucyl/phenylalanyl-tRNA--protein transferase [Rhodovarius sp.]|nr:leucyl/phenylalanyl-tRNA--protein transferase [Rhodovarius sp.]
MSRRGPDLTPELMLRAYCAGLFPMAEGRMSPRLYWLDPEWRGILPLDRFRLPRRLRRTVLRGPFQVTSDRAFAAVVAGCAEPAPGREDTWINPAIEALFNDLHRRGYGHSIEVWRGGALVGGLFGVALGGAFFGESMFSRATDASKVALVHLVARLRIAGFSLLDTQFTTAHLAQFGTVEIPRAEYKARLAAALRRSCDWPQDCDPARLEAEILALRPPSGTKPGRHRPAGAKE